MDGDGDGCPTRWLETEFDDSVMEKFILILKISPIGSMKSTVVPTFLPALSEVCSLAVLAGGRCCGKPPGSGRVSHSASVYPTELPTHRLGCGRFAKTAREHTSDKSQSAGLILARTSDVTHHPMSSP